MTVMEAIAHVDTVKPNGYSQDEKLRWLSVLDGTVKAEIIDTHEGAEEVAFAPYDGHTDFLRELLVPAPYDEAYLYYLEAEIYRATREIDKYASCAALYNGVVNDYKNKYFREHRQKAIPNMRYW